MADEYRASFGTTVIAICCMAMFVLFLDDIVDIIIVKPISWTYNYLTSSEEEKIAAKEEKARAREKTTSLDWFQLFSVATLLLGVFLIYAGVGQNNWAIIILGVTILVFSLYFGRHDP